MPVFRPGKPYRLLSLTANTPAAAGVALVPFDQVESDGEWGPSTGGGQVEVAVAGLYVARLGVSLTTATACFGLIRLGGVNRAWTQASQSCVASWWAQLEAGEVIGFYRTFSGARVLDADSTRAELVRVGPVRWT